jgi:3-deoxy-7-phosphoheptulonate synthase
VDAAALTTVTTARQAVHRVLHGADDRLLVVVGPCSIHDSEAALDYARRLRETASRHAADLLVVMRVYFEKPRTTVGWKGFINDPHLDGTFAINQGLRLARKLLLDINRMGLPAGTEFLDLLSPQYVSDLIAWGAIGARTTESQTHRQLASGLSCPDRIQERHRWLGARGRGRGACRRRAARLHGNDEDRAGGDLRDRGQRGLPRDPARRKTPNYDAASVEAAAKELAAVGLAPHVMIDFSHANSSKQFRKQVEVGADVAAQLAAGDERIVGVMVESHIAEGRQDLTPGAKLAYGVSITDACIGWEDTERVLDNPRRRRAQAPLGTPGMTKPVDEFRILGRRPGNEDSIRFTYNGVTFDQDCFHVVAGLNAVDTREFTEQTFKALQEKRPGLRAHGRVQAAHEPLIRSRAMASRCCRTSSSSPGSTACA